MSEEKSIEESVGVFKTRWWQWRARKRRREELAIQAEREVDLSQAEREGDLRAAMVRQRAVEAMQKNNERREVIRRRMMGMQQMGVHGIVDFMGHPYGAATPPPPPPPVFPDHLLGTVTAETEPGPSPVMPKVHSLQEQLAQANKKLTELQDEDEQLIRRIAAKTRATFGDNAHLLEAFLVWVVTESMGVRSALGEELAKGVCDRAGVLARQYIAIQKAQVDDDELA